LLNPATSKLSRVKEVNYNSKNIFLDNAIPTVVSNYSIFANPLGAKKSYTKKK